MLVPDYTFNANGVQALDELEAPPEEKSLPLAVGLSPKQARFAYLAARGDMTPTQAALEAGYESRNIDILLSDPKIQREMIKHRATVQQVLPVTREEVVDMFREAADMSRMLGDPATLVRAASEMGKMAGYYNHAQVQAHTDKDGNVTMTAIKQMTTEQLEELQASVPNARVVDHE